jgi:hypothetical protein
LINFIDKTNSIIPLSWPGERKISLFVMTRNGKIPSIALAGNKEISVALLGTGCAISQEEIVIARNEEDSFVCHCEERSDVAISKKKVEIAALPAVARNDNLLFEIAALPAVARNDK